MDVYIIRVLQTEPSHKVIFQVMINTDDMDLAGDLIQALATFLNIDDLHTNIDFPDEMEKLRGILVKVSVHFSVGWQVLYAVQIKMLYFNRLLYRKAARNEPLSNLNTETLSDSSHFVISFSSHLAIKNHIHKRWHLMN